MEDRYSRHILLDKFGEEGQAKMSKAKVVVVGCGGLGCLVATYLAGAGVKSLTLIDGDSPDVSNLHRQVMYTTTEQHPKSIALATQLKALNPLVEYISVTEYLTKVAVEDHLFGADVVIECTDDQACKYLVNDYCALENIPMIYGAIHKYEGYVSVFINQSEDDVHLRDIFPQPDMNIPSCSEVGVLSTTAGLISMMQANEAIKLISGVGQTLDGKLLTYNVLDNRQMTLKIQKSWEGDLEEVYEETDYTPADCIIVPSVSVEELIADPESYTLLSILTAQENAVIDQEMIDVKWTDKEKIIALAKDQKCIVCCRSGRKSKALVSQILTDHPSLHLANLEGGLMAYQRFKASH